MSAGGGVLTGPEYPKFILGLAEAFDITPENVMFIIRTISIKGMRHESHKENIIKIARFLQTMQESLVDAKAKTVQITNSKNKSTTIVTLGPVQGAMSTVFQTNLPGGGKNILKSVTYSNIELFRRGLVEICIQGYLSSFGICPAIKTARVNREKGRLYSRMEYISGGDLFSNLEPIVLTLPSLLQIIAPIYQLLYRARERYGLKYHGDCHLGNIVYNLGEFPDKPKLIDFGKSFLSEGGVDLYCEPYSVKDNPKDMAVLLSEFYARYADWDDTDPQVKFFLKKLFKPRIEPSNKSFNIIKALDAVRPRITGMRGNKFVAYTNLLCMPILDDVLNELSRSKYGLDAQKNFILALRALSTVNIGPWIQECYLAAEKVPREVMGVYGGGAAAPSAAAPSAAATGSAAATAAPNAAATAPQRKSRKRRSSNSRKSRRVVRK